MSLFITNSLSLLKLMSIKLVMPSNHLILCHTLLFQGNRLSCRDQEGRRGSEEAVPGPSVFPSGDPGVDCHFLLQGIFPTQGSCIAPTSLALAGRFFTTALATRMET